MRSRSESLAKYALHRLAQLPVCCCQALQAQLEAFDTKPRLETLVDAQSRSRAGTLESLASPDATPRSHAALCMAIRNNSDLMSPRSTRSTGGRSRAGSKATAPANGGVEAALEELQPEESMAEKRARERAERREKELARIQAAGGLNLGNGVPSPPRLSLGQRGPGGTPGADSGMVTHRSMELNRLDAELREEMVDK